jgi:hypothetical protein
MSNSWTSGIRLDGLDYGMSLGFIVEVNGKCLQWSAFVLTKQIEPGWTHYLHCANYIEHICKGRQMKLM